MWLCGWSEGRKAGRREGARRQGRAWEQRVCAHWVIGGEVKERTACRVDRIPGHPKG